jgi:PAS domain S-box-containing protein
VSKESERQRRLLEAGEELAGTGTWMLDTGTGELIWSRNMFRIFGVDPDAGVPSNERRAELIHPDDREPREREIDRIRRGATDQQFDFRIVHPDGSIRHVYSTIAVTEAGGEPRRVLGYVQDLASTRLAEREIAIHLATVEALSREDLPDHGVGGLLRRLALALGCSYAVLWTPGDHGLLARASWMSAMLVADNRELSRDGPLDRSAGPIVIDAISKRSPVVENHSGTRTNPTDRHGLGFASTLAFPAVAGTEALGALEFRSRETIQMTERFVRSLIGVGHEIGAYFAHHMNALHAPALTPRELEVLRLAADGVSGPAIAEALEISPATVKTHFEHIYGKLGVSDRASAVAVALRTGLFE